MNANFLQDRAEGRTASDKSDQPKTTNGQRRKKSNQSPKKRRKKFRTRGR